MSNLDLSTAKQFDMQIISQWKGYNSTNDKTNVAINVIVQGSQNIYKKLSGNLSVRPGQKRIGAADSTQSPVSSEFIWNTSWGATYPLWVSNSKLQVSINNVWYTLLSSLTSTRWVFDKWWSAAEGKDRVLMVDGDSNIYHWSGGSTTILSSTANTITKTGTTTWQQAGFSTTAGEKTILINGTTYTYTGGESTTTLTGVSPSPIGEALGSIVLQAVQVASNTPAAGFHNDFIKVINNQAYIGSYTSRLCYISSDIDFKNYVVPTPRLSGSPELLTLDSTLNGIGVKTGNAAISIGTGEWAIVSFSDITVGTTLTQKTNVDLKPIAKGAAAYAHEFISNSGDNVIYLAKDQQVREFGNFNDLFYNAYPSLSLEIATELSAENFSGGGLKCIGEFTYLTSPASGKTYLYQVRQGIDANNTVIVERLWHSPFIWNATRIDDIDGTVVAFSNSNPQVYRVWDTNQWHDDSPSDEPLPYECILARSYQTGGRRQGLLSFDKTFSEGYFTLGTPLNIQINYNYEGSLNSPTQPVNSISRPGYNFGVSAASLGDSSLGDKSLGDESSNTDIPVDLQQLVKFKVINSWALTNCFEYQVIYSSDTADVQWEILASGDNVRIESEQDASFIINKLRL
jgi:hypothetical protein